MGSLHVNPERWSVIGITSRARGEGPAVEEPVELRAHLGTGICFIDSDFARFTKLRWVNPMQLRPRRSGRGNQSALEGGPRLREAGMQRQRRDLLEPDPLQVEALRI